MLVLWDAGVNNELFTLIFTLNMKSNITVLTPNSPMEEFFGKDIVKQGTRNGPILCSTSAGQYCADKYAGSKTSRVFIGTRKVKPAALVDDLIDPNRTVSDIISLNKIWPTLYGLPLWPTTLTYPPNIRIWMLNLTIHIFFITSLFLTSSRIEYC